MTIAPLADRIAKLRQPTLLAFDVDGTLAPMCNDPSQARVSDALLRQLSKLNQDLRWQVALITGRDAPGLDAVCPLNQVWRAVDHGRQLLAPGQEVQSDGLSAEEWHRFSSLLAWLEKVANPPTIVVERKQRSVALHARALAQSDPKSAQQLLESCAHKALMDGLAVRMGRHVCECELNPGNKADALARLFREGDCKSVVYIGDDLTDFDAIRFAANQSQGLGFFVASDDRPQGPGEGAFVLDGTKDVAALIAALCDLRACVSG